MAKKIDDKTLILLVLGCLKHGEISEGKAVELLRWPRNRIRDEMKSRCGSWTPYADLCDTLDRCEATLAETREIVRRQYQPSEPVGG